MKLIGISQRVDYIQSYQERRDSLDQRFSRLLAKLDYLTIPLANHSNAKAMLEQLGLSALLLSGGNSLAFLDKTAEDCAPERDQFEADLLSVALARQLPVVGICRGMQMINHYLGGRLCPVENHVATRHPIRWLDNEWNIKGPKDVNSYHQYGIALSDLAHGLIPLALDEHDHVEAFIHQTHPILGLLWHPERESSVDPLDLTLLKRVLP